MKKSEFLSNLRKALSGSLSSEEVEYHIRYYSDYINAEVRKGIKEEIVIEQIGDPWLIAKTIENAEKNFSKRGFENRNNNNVNQNNKYDKNNKFVNIKRSLSQILALILVIFVIVLIIGFIGGIILILLKLAIPILIIILILYLIRKLS